MSPSSTPDIEHLIPHREPMLLLRSVRDWGDGWIRCTGSIPRGNALAGSESASVFLGIEMGAQAAAAHESIRIHGSSACSPGEAMLGYLVSVRAAKFPAKSIPLGEELMVEARLVGSAGPLAMYAIAVVSEDNDRLLVEAQISTLRVPGNPQSSLEASKVKRP